MVGTPELAELPELAIFRICGHLSYEDLINFRVTCKRLKAVVDQRPSPLFRSLHLFVAEYPFEQELFYTGELVSHANIWRVHNLDILNSTKFKNQFTGLRKLTTHLVCARRWAQFPESKSLKLSDLNYFKGLVYLEFQWNSHFVRREKLSLRNLKIAAFEHMPPDHGVTHFDLECPQLQVLGVTNKTRVWPTDETYESIRHLYVNKVLGTQDFFFVSRVGHDRDYPFPLYEKLNNLSTISFRLVEDLNGFLVSVIGRRKRLPSLKRIVFEKGISVSEEMLRNLLNLKSRPETKHVEVQMNGKVLDTSELTEMLDLLDQINLKSFYVRTIGCYEQIKHLTENPILDCLLPGAVRLFLHSREDVTLGKQLIEKLKELMSLDIILDEGTAVDKEFFELTLRTCRKLKRLRIKGAWLKQEQLDQIPNYFQNLSSLVFELNELGLGKLKFDFTSKLKNLFEIQFDVNIDQGTMSLLLKNCHYQPDFRLLFAGKQLIRIYGQRNKNGLFQIVCRSHWEYSIKTDEFNSIEEAIEYYYSHDLFNTPFRTQVIYIRF